MSRENITRRDFLRVGATCALAAGAGAIPALRAFGDDDYGPFRMGIQSYSLRAFTLDEAIEMTNKLHLHYWESFQAHIPQTDSKERQQEILAKLKAADIKLTSWGVQGFDGDEAKARATFDFAKAMKLETIAADPAPASLDLLSKLVAEYKINIAIHNHGPGARYDKLPSVLTAVNGRHPRLGVCVDTGHTLRSGEDPVEWVKALGPRVHDVHLKDVKDTKIFTEVGKGDLRTVDLFRELRRIKFKGVVNLEYEEHEKAPGPYIDLCLAATRDAIAKAMNQK
jgi:inosose dehydratase